MTNRRNLARTIVKPRIHLTPSQNRWAILLVLAVFAACSLVRYLPTDADDLGSSYIGCRLLSTGNADHLYRYDPENFAAIGPDDQWQAAADQGDFESFLHPYVQTPLWAYILQPVCKGSFQSFERLFAVLAVLSFAACVWLVAFYWAPALYTPWGIGLVLLCLWFTEPFRYAMALMQTHIFFVLLTIAGLILAERRRPGFAGLALACAAAVKITPGALLIYWFLTRRWKAAASTVIWSAVIWVATIFATGHQLFGEYLACLQRVSHVLLLSQNNQSFAAWCMGRFYSAKEVAGIHILPLPAAVRVGSALLLIAFTVGGGLLDRREARLETRRRTRPNMAPLGAMIALLAATVFGPISWTHYGIVLVAPLMMLAQESWTRRSWWLAAMVVLIAALNIQPLATNVQDSIIGPFSILRSHFYSEILCLFVLGITAWRGQPSGLRSQGQSLRERYSTDQTTAVSMPTA